MLRQDPVSLGVEVLVGSSGTMENIAAVFAAEEKLEGSIYEQTYEAQALRKTTKASPPVWPISALRWARVRYQINP